MSTEREIHALIQLLDDSDPEVYKHVHDKLMSLGVEIVPQLEAAWSTDISTATHERLEEIIHRLQFDALVKEWKLWMCQPKPDLLTGAHLIAKYYYPEADYELVLKKMQKIKQSIWLELNYHQTPLEQIQIFNQVFYTHYSFKGSEASHSYQDYCINHVLDGREGSALAIGILYQSLANELNLPVYGVNLYKHYVLAFCKKMIFEFEKEQHLSREVMFYINPINKGSIFSRNEIKDYLQKLAADTGEENYAPADTATIIKAVLFALIEVSEANQKPETAAELNYLLKLF